MNTLDGLITNALLLDRTRGQDVLDSLVRAAQVILDRDRVLDLEPDQGSGDQERATEQTPVGRKLRHVGQFVLVETPHHGGTGGLQALVESGQVGKLAAGVAEGTHHPVSVS